MKLDLKSISLKTYTKWLFYIIVVGMIFISVYYNIRYFGIWELSESAGKFLRYERISGNYYRYVLKGGTPIWQKMKDSGDVQKDEFKLDKFSIAKRTALQKEYDVKFEKFKAEEQEKFDEEAERRVKEIEDLKWHGSWMLGEVVYGLQQYGKEKRPSRTWRIDHVFGEEYILIETNNGDWWWIGVDSLQELGKYYTGFRRVYLVDYHGKQLYIPANEYEEFYNTIGPNDKATLIKYVKHLQSNPEREEFDVRSHYDAKKIRFHRRSVSK